MLWCFNCRYGRKFAHFIEEGKSTLRNNVHVPPVFRKRNEKGHFQAAQWSVLSTSCIFMAPAVGLVWYCVILNPTWIAFSSGKPLHIKHDGAIMMFGLQMPLDSDEDHAYNKWPYSFPSKEMVRIKLIAYKDIVHHQSCT